VPLGKEISFKRGHQRGVTPPLRNRYFTTIGSSSVKTVADRHRLAAYHSKHCRRADSLFIYLFIYFYLLYGLCKQTKHCIMCNGVGVCKRKIGVQLWCTRCVQLECARVLLFRGADKHILNRTTFDAHRVACISQHKRIADLIEGFQNKDVGNYV